MLDVIRLVTVHPLLVHFTLGGFGIITLAYVVAAWLRSPGWTLVGDVALVTTAGITFVTFAFGLVSNAALPWPGGIHFWRWLHLGFGAFLTAALGVLATMRLSRASRFAVSGAGTALVAIGIAAVAAWTGWIGGEVLVYRAGMAVQAAGSGSLAPPVVASKGSPAGLKEGMDRLRAHWGSATTHLALMVVQRPLPFEFAVVAKDGETLKQLAQWLADITSTQGKHPSTGSPVAVDPPTPGNQASNGNQAFPDLAKKLMAGAGQLQQSAHDANLEQATRSSAEIEGTCAACHEQFRWH